MSGSIRQQRAPVRFQGLKDGSFSAAVSRLWKTAFDVVSVATPPVVDELRRFVTRAQSSETAATAAAATTAAAGVTISAVPLSEPADPVQALLLQPVTTALSALKDAIAVERKEAGMGDLVYGLTCNLFCTVVHNQPAVIKGLHNDGTTASFLASLSPVPQRCNRCEVIIHTVCRAR
jgi:hypothetical protein